MWPDPLKIIDDAIANMTQGPRHQITWFYQTGASGAEIEQFLRSYGVRVWGRTYERQDGETIWYGLHVRQSQARWACTLILTIGVPIRTGAVEGARPMKSLPRTSWDSVAKPVGLGGIVTGWITGRPKAANTRPRGSRKKRRRSRHARARR